MKSKISGKMCSESKRCSRVCVGGCGIWLAGLFFCVVRNIWREYAPVSKVVSPVRITVGGHQLYREERIISSPIRFVVGGRAMFMRFAINHQVAIRGSVSWRPRVSSRVRVWVRS